MELLIVIAIIGILVSISVVSYSSAQKKSRDSRRVNDMKAVQNAWEQYYADNSANYPAGCAFSATPAPGVMSGTYLPGGMPTDPQKGTTYVSIATGWGNCAPASYCFCAGLENANGGNATTDCAGLAAPAGYSGLYCVKNLQ